MKLLDNEIRPTHPTTLLRASNCLVFLLLIAINVVTQSAILGTSDLEISSKFPTPLTPASWAFTIWGAILGLQAVGVVYQALPQGYASDGMKQRYVNGIGYGWQLGWLGEMAWQLLFQLRNSWGMILCVISLAAAFVALGRTLFNMYRLKEAHGSLSSILMYVAFFLPTSINTAWLSYASAIATLMVPKALQYNAHIELYAVFLAIIVTIAGVAVIQKYRDSAYGLTLVWAFVAVYGEQLESKSMRVVSLVCICANTLAAIFSMLRRKNLAAELSDVRQPLSRINTI